MILGHLFCLLNNDTSDVYPTTPYLSTENLTLFLWTEDIKNSSEVKNSISSKMTHKRFTYLFSYEILQKSKNE